MSRSSDVRTALDRLAGAAPHLRWRLATVGDALGEGELACATLAADPDALAATVAASAAGRGSDDPQVLASLWWQAYAYRVAGTALACWLLNGVVPVVRAEVMAVGVARSRPSSVVYLVRDATAPRPPEPTRSTGRTRGNDSRPAPLEAPTCGGRTPLPRESGGGSNGLASPVAGDLARVVDELFPGHLDRVAAALRARHALGRPLLWGNVAAACASAAGAVRAAAGHRWRDRLDTFLAAAPHDLAGLGRWTFPDDPSPDAAPHSASDPGADGPTYRRTSCCLWWKTTVAGGALCADCSLTRSPIETSPA